MTTDWRGWPGISTGAHCQEPAPWPPPQAIGERVTAAETTLRHYSEVMRHFDRSLSQLLHQSQDTAARMAALETVQQRHVQQLAVVEFVPAWISSEEARRADGARAKKDRSEARREALALVQYVIAILLVVSAALGVIPWEHLGTVKSVLVPGP